MGAGQAGPSKPSRTARRAAIIASVKAALRLVCVALMCSALSACGGSHTTDRQQIVNLFNGMFAAMAHGDYASACSDLSQRQQNVVAAGARRGGLNVSSCAGALTTVFKRSGITRAQLAQTFGVGAKRKIDSLSVHGNQATVTVTESSNGQTYVETDALVREGGKWRADRILKRSQTA
jgi:hypothetical protein